jgi:tripartite-type tricarboxylate transporter receptor subunit TctC
MKNRKREIRTSGSVRDEDGQHPHLLGRRQFLHLAAGAAALPTVSRIARAQTYPTRPTRIIVGFPPAGSHDILARLTGQWLSEHLGQPFVIENRPGANGNIGTEAVVRSAADGYTLLTVGSPNAINASLYEKLNFDFLRDIALIGGAIRYPLVMAVNPSFPAASVPEFIAVAKSNQRKINMGSGGVGNPTHVSGELFKMMTGLEMLHIPYRGGGPAVADLIGGQVQVVFATVPSSAEHIRARTLRGLAVTTATRSDTLPEIPTMGDFVPGYEASDWVGFGVPRNTPPDIVEKLNKQINAMVADPKVKARFAELGGVPLGGSAGDFGKLIAADTEKWAGVLKFAGAKADRDIP